MATETTAKNPIIQPTEITLRDVFAMQALNGLIANGELTRASNDAKRHGGAPELSTAYMAYQLADAMLEARDAE